MLAEEGHSIIGVAMQVWDYRRGNATKATCCAPADFDDARTVSNVKNFPFYVFDFEDSFAEGVITPFINAYLSGVTPNPCLDCNRKVKFRELRNRARTFGARAVATGHYARIRTRPDGSRALYTARDLTKDQSYFLYALTQPELGETLFPVGDMTKPEVRAYLESRGLSIASKPESQDICFVSGSAAEFVENGVKKTIPGGEIVARDGTPLGTHSGIHHFTVGQRRGLGVSAHEKLYVLRIDPETNRVQVGAKEELEQREFFVTDVNWVSGRVPTEKVRVRVKMRYRHDGVLADVFPPENTDPADAARVRVEFVDEWSAVSPGQAAVFYAPELEADGAREVLGGGIIAR